jgi:hypothetical protein
MGRTPGHLLNPSRSCPPAIAGTAAQRRAGLQAALALLGWAALPAVALCAPAPTQRPGAQLPQVSQRPQRTQLDEALGQCGLDAPDARATLARQGAIYLDAHPAERDPAVLSRLLALGAATPVQQRLLAAIAGDWNRHDIVTVDGWLLARSEARLCALIFLLAPA